MKHSNVQATDVNAIQAVSFMLQEKHNSEVYKSLVTLLVYRTLELNSNITLNQLKYMLSQHYSIPFNAIDGAIASLTAPSLFNCVSKFQKPSSPPGAVHLNVKKPVPDIFSNWLQNMLEKYPALDYVTGLRKQQDQA